MAVRIRLARFGCRNRSFYRVVAIHDSNRRDGKQLEVLGHYDPLSANDDDKRIGLKIDRIKYWLSVGAQPSDTVQSILFMKGVLPLQPVLSGHKSKASNILPNDALSECSATTPKDNSDIGGYGNDAYEDAENLNDNSHLWYNIGVQISPSGSNPDRLLQILGLWASPFVMRPRIALNLKNVKYDFLPEQLGSKSELLLKSNPVHKKIPVMIHNDKPICESLVIVQYIDDFFTSSGPAILPVEPYERAISRFWAAYVDDKWVGLLLGVTMAKTEDEKKTAIEALTAGVGLFEDAFQEISTGKSYFGGDTVGYVDIAFGSCLGWVRVLEKMNGFTLLDERSTPGLYGWAERFCVDEAVKDVMPETEKLIELLH